MKNAVRAAPPSPEAARVLALLSRILRDGGRVSLQTQARSLRIPISTTYRLVSQLRADGLVRRCGRGTFSAGLELAKLTAALEPRRLIVQISRPHLKRLAERLGVTVHLGVLEEDMVTYLTKIDGGGPRLFTRSGTQLEAYCSAVGKVLLAALPPAALDLYLAGGPLVSLTANTIVDSRALKRALASIQAKGFAIDDEEVMENLRCIAVPLCDRQGHVAAAVSVSRMAGADTASDALILASLRDCARRIEALL